MTGGNPYVIYDIYDVRRIRWRDSGTRMMPVAAPNYQAAQAVQLFAAIEYELVLFLVAATGNLPVVPSEKDLLQDSNYNFIESKFGGMSQQPQPDGRLRFYVWGQYLYGINIPVGLDNGFNLAVPPWSSDPAGTEQVPPANFQTGILNSTPLSQPAVQNPPSGNYQQYLYAIRGQQD